VAFWSGETLLQTLPVLIDPFDKKQVDCAAYTLRMGAEVYVSPSESEQAPDKITIQKLTFGQAFPIPAGQFAFLLTEETIKVPLGKIAFISMKTGIKLRGLVNVSGFHVDPGYSGNLIFAVFNAGPKTIHLRRGEDCFLIWYADLDNPNSKMAKAAPGFNSIPTDVVTKISGEIMSFDGLNAKIKDLQKDYEARIHNIENDHRTITTVGKIVLGVLFTLLVSIVITPYVKNGWEWWIKPTTTPASPAPAPHPAQNSQSPAQPSQPEAASPKQMQQSK
jgi:dCTP deaminase